MLTKKEERQFDNLIVYYVNLKPTVPKKTKLDKLRSTEDPRDIKDLLLVIHAEDNECNSNNNQIVDRCPIEILTMGISYLERIVKRGLVLHDKNHFVMLWFSCILAHKFSSDEIVNSCCLSNLGGFNMDLYSKVEKWLLKGLEWNLVIPSQTYLTLTAVSKRRHFEPCQEFCLTSWKQALVQD